MAPKPDNLKLSRDAFQGVGGEGGTGSKASNKPPSVIRLAIGGTAGISAINTLTLQYKNQGFGKDKQATKLGGVAYELNPGEKADATLDAFRVAFETPGNVPVTLIHPLTGAVDPSKLPPPDTPPQFAQVCFALPTISKASDVQGDNEQKWLQVFKIASERQLTLELAVPDQDDVREAVEKLLGKAWDQEQSAIKQAGNGDEAETEQQMKTKGMRILFDALASPPLSENGSQLTRSKDLESWSDFVSRLALNPRVYLKVSPLPLPSAVLPVAVATHRRPVDAFGSTVPVPGANLAGSATQTAVDAASNAVSTAEASATSLDPLDEMQQRLRVFLEIALEAFGDQRLVWTAQLSAGGTAAAAAASGEKQLSEPEQWFEIVLRTLQRIGVDQEAIENVFCKNVSVIYRM